MHRFLVALLLIALPASLHAAEPDSAATARPNSLRAGAWALQFSITSGQFFDLDSFAGGVSLKRHFSTRSAVRAGLSASASDGGGSNGYSVGTEFIYQRYLRPEAEANAYWGVGPELDYSHRWTAQQVTDSLSVHNESTQYSVGAKALLGVEWFASRVISLHAEYQVFWRHTHRETRRELTALGSGTVVVDSQETESWEFLLNDLVRFGLSVYF